jgi:hypothetical protein
MRNRINAIAVAVVLGFFGVLAVEATPYWVDWEGNGGQWPESAGFEREWGNWQGPNHGGANRTLENGVLTYDSLYDPGVYDFYEMDRPGAMNPGPGETFVMEWRLKVDAVSSDDGDPGVVLFSDDAWGISFRYTTDHIRSVFESYLNIPFAPYVWHDYRLVSSGLRSYDLYIDGTLARQGAFVHVITQSVATFGEGTQGVASLHHWDYYRFGVVAPEPGALALVVWVMAWRGARRR